MSTPVYLLHGRNDQINQIKVKLDNIKSRFSRCHPIHWMSNNERKYLVCSMCRLKIVIVSLQKWSLWDCFKDPWNCRIYHNTIFLPYLYHNTIFVWILRSFLLQVHFADLKIIGLSKTKWNLSVKFLKFVKKI